MGKSRRGRAILTLMLAATMALVLSLPRGAIAQSGSAPAHLQLVPNAASQQWTQQPGSRKQGPVQLLVHVDKAPLAMVGRFWTHDQRRAYVNDIRALQDALVPQIQALGGTVVGRFAQASAGLGVVIDASKVTQLRGLANVVGVSGVQNYELALGETVPWIGATAVQQAGVTGKHPWTGEGIDVAVIDSGIDFTHVKLGGPGTTAAYAQAYCGSAAITPDPTNPACQAAAAAPADPALFGPDAPKVKGGYDWVGELWPTFSANIAPDPNPIDFEGHGTHVADIIGGFASAPGAGDQGVAPDVNIWGFKACSAVSSSCNGLALLLAVDDALDLDDSDYGACDPIRDDWCTTFDPADVINMSLGSIYGQPEDDLTHFANIASYYGSVVVASAGNSGDRPYIVGSPSAAAGAISVAQSSVPSDKLYRITAGNVAVGGVLQPWGPGITAPITGQLQYGNGAGGNTLGCAAFPAGSLAGKVLLVDRGTCAISIKAANGSAAGAVLVVIANNSFSNTPPSFSFGGGTVTAPALTVTQNDGAALRGVLGQTASVAPGSFIALQDDIVASSSRGPRIQDGAIKPDIAAPGASVSAVAGSGNGKVAFGGTSGAAPMVAGTAALMVEALEQRGILRDANPGVVIPGLSVTPLVKAMLMSTANPNVYIGGSLANGGRGFLAPITLQGAGRVDALAAYQSQTTALDVTELYTWLMDPNSDAPCTVTTPPTNELTHLVLPEFYNGSYNCISAYPFGNDFFNAWNALSGSLSFGYDGVSTNHTETRYVLIGNFGDSDRSYNLSSAFRYADDAIRGASVTVTPASVTIPARSTGVVAVTVAINAGGLRDWTLDAGVFGASGTNIYCDMMPPSSVNPRTGCPTLTMFEYDGYITIDGGPNNSIRMPWQILPKQTADTSVTGTTPASVAFANASPYKATLGDAFALVEVSPNNCEIVDGDGNCIEENYQPGILPAINTTAIDIANVGVRGYTVPNISKAAQVIVSPSSLINDDVVDFAVTVYDKPYRASHNFPVEFDIYVDSDGNGVDDYVVFNFDVALTGSDGRNAVFVADINPANGTRPTRPYFYSNTNINSQNWILPVPAAAIDVTANRPFKFYVLAFDAYFTGSLWDCSPFNCGEYHTYQVGRPKYRPNPWSFRVERSSSYTLPFRSIAGGAAASPSQDGLLFLYRDALVGRESDVVLLP
jgi:subtilisin family serine protease